MTAISSSDLLTLPPLISVRCMVVYSSWHSGKWFMISSLRIKCQFVLASSLHPHPVTVLQQAIIPAHDTLSPSPSLLNGGLNMFVIVSCTTETYWRKWYNYGVLPATLHPILQPDTCREHGGASTVQRGLIRTQRRLIYEKLIVLRLH